MINRKISSRRCAALAAAAASFTATAAPAATPTTQPVDWVGPAGTPTAPGDYNEITHWNPNTLPENDNQQFLQIGNGGTATMSGTASYEGAWLMLGMRGADGATPAQSGHLQISGGTITLGEMRVGGREVIADNLTDWGIAFTPNAGGTGSVNQTGGDVFIGFSTGTEPPIQSLYIGDGGLASDNTANGSYTISAGTLTSGIADNDAIVVGTGVGTQGTFLQSGGTVTSRGFLSVARRGANATYTMNGGTLNVGLGATLSATPGRALWVGDGDAAGIQTTTGTFVQNNGIINVGDATISANQNLDIARRSGKGDYTIKAGEINIVNGSLTVGGGGEDPDGPPPGGPIVADPILMKGQAIMRVEGGAITISDSVLDGTTGDNNSRGNLNVGITSNSIAGGTTTGTLIQTGGTITLNDPNSIVGIGNGIGATGTLDISGGTFAQTGTTAQFEIGRNQGTALVKVSNTGTLTVDQLTIASNNNAVTRELRVEGGTLNVDFWEMGAANAPLLTRVVNISGGKVNVTGTGATHRGGRLVTYNLTGGSTNFAGIFALDTSTMNIGTGGTPAVAPDKTAKFATYRNGSGTTTITGGTVEFANFNDTGNQGGVVTMSGGTVDVTGTYNITSSAPAVAGVLNLTGANATFNNLTTGGSATLNSALNISGGNVAVTGLLTLSTGTTLKTDNTIALASNILMGTATVNVNTGSLALSGNLTSSAARTLTKTGPGTLTIGGGTQSHVAGSAITNSAGTLNLNSSGGPNLTVNANSTTNFGGSHQLAALNVGGTATATLVNDGSANRVINANTLTIGPNARLDLKNNKLVTNSAVGIATDGVYNGIQGEVQRAYNFGAWDQPGLMTSEENAGQNAGPLSGTTTIGVATAEQILFIGPTDTTTFAGQTVTGASTIAMYTYAGDVNFDGLVDGADYGTLDNWIQFPGTSGYANGDVNYDGVIDGADYGVLDNSIQLQGDPFPGAFSAFEGGASASLSGVTAVPEPSACGLAVLGAAGLFTRRRRRSR